jgi:hypothetical protein
MADIKKVIEIDVDNSGANKNLDSTNKKLETTSKKSTKITQKTGKLSSSFSGLGSTLDGVTGGAVSGFKGMLGGVKGLTGGFKGLKGAIIATGLGALVLVVITLIQYFSKFDAATRLISQAMAGLTGFVDGIINNFEKLLELDVVGFFKGVTDSVVDGVDATGKLIDAQRALQKLNTELLTTNAKLNVELGKQKKILEDTTLSFDERRKAQVKINEITETLLQNEKDRISLEKEAAKQALRTAGSEQETRDAREKLQQATADLIKVEGDLNLERQEASKKLREVNEQEEAQDESNAKAKKKRNEEIVKANKKLIAEEESRVKTLVDLEESYNKQLEDMLVESNVERIELQRDRALEELKLLEATEEEKKSIIRAINAKFDKELSDSKDAKVEIEKEKEAERIIALEEFRRNLNKQIEDENVESKLEKKLLDLEREKEDTLAELERLEATEAEKARIKAFYDGKVVDAKEEANKEEEKNTKLKDDALIASSLNAVSSIISAIDEGSDAAKAMAVAQALWNTYQGITAGVKLGYPAAIPAVAFAATTGFAAVKNILSTDVGTTGGAQGSNGGAAAPQANFNTVGDTRQSAIDEAEANSEQEPTQAYVVSTEVSSQQALDRNRVNNSTFLG